MLNANKRMERMEMVEEFFNELCDSLNLSWYEVYDSDLFEKVLDYADSLGILETKEFDEWEYELYMDL